MRLSGPIKRQYTAAAHWIGDVAAAGYRAAELPLDHRADTRTVDEFLAAAADADIQISEVGAWSNPIDPDPAKARAAVAHCQEKLKWAERIGAKCCVNIAGSRNPRKWDGPHPENFGEETFDLIVSTVREIVDAVRPQRTYYALETMPWIFPSSPDEYLSLLKAIDRPGVAVHLDPVNMINSPARLYRNADFIVECFAKLGPLIKSCHAKDIVLREVLTVHLDECRPGTGALDYTVYLRELAKLDRDTPLCLEHLPEAEYPPAARYIQTLSSQLGLA
jgi:sugar phosphate isomerase/epimerase